MKIAINTRLLLPRLEGIGNYTLEVLRNMVEQHPDDEFHFFFDRKYDPRFLFAPNVIPHVIWPQARHPLLWTLWFDHMVTRKLAELKPDVFFSPEAFLSKNSEVPTVMTVHDLAYLAFPEGTQKSHFQYLKKQVPLFLERADRISCVSAFTKMHLLEHFPQYASKCHVHHNGLSNGFTPISEELKRSVKLKYTDGKPYFLYLGAIHPRKNIFRLLRAFEGVKKDKSTAYKLVLAGRFSWDNDTLIKAIENSPYNADIVLLDHIVTERYDLMGAADVFCYPSLFEGFGLPVLEAMSCGVPVITSRNSAMEEVGGQHVLTVDPLDTDKIQAKMLRIIQDRVLAKELAEKGQHRAQNFKWSNTAEGVYRLLTDTVKSR